ncbi:sperm-associated antigen 7 [Ammospiza caudacuta]|nr:sperm-associated antigen 7 [Ammospiza caudacuta]
MAELDLLGSILNSMERPPAAADGETRRRAREQAARMKKLQEQEKRQKVEFRKRMEQEVSQFIQATGEPRRRFQPMTKIERSILHDVAEVAGLTSFSFGDDEDSRYVMVFKKEFAPSDEELEAYRRGEEWDPARAEERRRLRELAAQQEEAELESGPAPPGPPNDYKDKYRHLIGCEAAKAAARTMEANKAYGCVPVANKRDTRSIEEAMNEIRAKKRLRQAEDEGGGRGGCGGALCVMGGGVAGLTPSQGPSPTPGQEVKPLPLPPESPAWRPPREAQSGARCRDKGVCVSRNNRESRYTGRRRNNEGFVISLGGSRNPELRDTEGGFEFRCIVIIAGCRIGRIWIERGGGRSGARARGKGDRGNGAGRAIAGDRNGREMSR